MNIHQAAKELVNQVVGVPVKKHMVGKLAGVPHIFLTLEKESDVFNLGFLSSGWYNYPVIIGHEKNMIMVSYCPIGTVNSPAYERAKKAIKEWMERTDPNQKPPEEIMDVQPMEEYVPFKSSWASYGRNEEGLPPGKTRIPPKIEYTSKYPAHLEGPMKAFNKHNQYVNDRKRCGRCQMEIVEENCSSIRFKKHGLYTGSGSLLLICVCGNKSQIGMRQKDAWEDEWEILSFSSELTLKGYLPETQPLKNNNPKEFDDYGYPIQKKSNIRITENGFDLI